MEKEGGRERASEIYNVLLTSSRPRLVQNSESTLPTPDGIATLDHIFGAAISTTIFNTTHNRNTAKTTPPRCIGGGGTSGGGGRGVWWVHCCGVCELWVCVVRCTPCQKIIGAIRPKSWIQLGSAFLHKSVNLHSAKKLKTSQESPFNNLSIDSHITMNGWIFIELHQFKDHPKFYDYFN